jgi:hypothetical protein
MFQLYTRYTLELPEGTISSTGIDLIGEFMESQNLEEGEWKAKNPNRSSRYLPDLPEAWDYTWLLQTGDFKGTFPKRVANYYRKEYSIKCPESFIRELGNLARQHSGEKSVYHFDFTDTIDWEDGDFGDSGSCYWGIYESNRHALQEGGGLAIRFFNEDGDGYARAWLVQYGSVYIVFNGYGFYNNPTLQIARVFAAFLNANYQNVDFYSDVYVNSDTAFVVGKVADFRDRYHYDLRSSFIGPQMGRM